MNAQEQARPNRDGRLNDRSTDHLQGIDPGEPADGAPADQTCQAAKSDTARSQAEPETIPPAGFQEPAQGTPEVKVCGRYRILRPLGVGGMGKVYLAEDPQLKRPVALKIPTLHGANDPQSLQRFYQEARLAATLNHANICQVYDIGEQDGTPFIAMAYIEGQPLSRLVGSRQLRSQRAMIVLIRKIALALAEAHAQGVVHRDMKPSNVLVNKRGEPIVTDFGLAHRTNKPGEERLTASGVLLGTPAYMAPEQVLGDLARVGPQSDIYSLGVILYELLTGQCPFTGTIAAVLAQILRDEPRKPSEIEPTVDPRLEAICLKMMAKSPEQRYGSAAEVAQELGKLISGATSGGKAALNTSQLEAQRHRIAAALRSGQFAAALAALEQMAQLRDAGSEPYAAWAEQELTRVRAIPQPIRDRGPQLVETAIELLASQQYAEAVRILSAWPAAYRSPEATKLLEKATRLDQEAKQLNARMAEAVGKGRYDSLRPVLERLLELEPGNLTARDLFEKLATYAPGQAYRFDAQGRLLPAQPESLLTLADRVLRGGLLGWARRQKYGQHPRRGSHATTAASSGLGLPILPIALGLGGAAIVLLAIIIFLRDGRYEVRVDNSRVAEAAEEPPSALTTDEPATVATLPTPPTTEPLASGTTMKDDTSDVQPTVTPPIPGIVPRPEPLPGVGRWQIFTRQIRHAVEDVAFSPDDRLIAVAAGPYVRLLNAENLELCAVLVGEMGYATSVRWSPDGKQIAAGGFNGTLHLWNIDGSQAATTDIGEAAIRDLDWSPDGRWLAVADRTSDLVLWNPNNSETRRVPQPAEVRCVAWKPDDDRLAVGRGNGTAVLNAQNEFQPELETEYSAWRLAWSPDGSKLAARHDGKELGVIDRKGTVLWKGELSGWGGDSSLAWSPGGESLAAVRFPSISIFRASGEKEKELGNAGSNSLAWNAEGSRLVTGGDSGAIVLYETDGWRQAALHADGRQHLNSLAWNRDGAWLASGYDANTVAIWNANGTGADAFDSQGGAVKGVAWNPTRDELATAGYHQFNLWKRDGTLVRNYETGAKNHWGVGWSPDGHHLVGRSTNHLTVWKIEGVKVAELDESLPFGNCVVWIDSLGGVGFPAAREGIGLWEPLSNQRSQIRTPFSAYWFAWHPGKKQFAVGNQRRFSVVDTEGRPQGDLPEFPCSVVAAAWSPGGDRIACTAGPLALVCSVDGNPLASLPEHSGPIASCDWSPDGRHLATGGSDSLVVVRDGNSYEPKWVGVCFRDRQCLVLDAGGDLLGGEPLVAENHFLYLVEAGNGRVDVLTPAEFRQRAGLPPLDSKYRSGLIVNGSFEFPVQGATNYQIFGVGPMYGWVVETETVDINAYQKPFAEGDQCLDLSGHDAGSIYQDVPTEPGATYRLRFAIRTPSSNAPPRSKVFWNGAELGSLASQRIDPGDKESPWQYSEYAVTATKAVTRLAFRSLIEGDRGDGLDDVSLTPIESPSPTEPAASAENGSGTRRSGGAPPRPPYDLITLDKANGNTVLKVLPLDLPGRLVPDPLPRTGRLRLRLFERPDFLYEVEWSHIEKIELFEQAAEAGQNEAGIPNEIDRASGDVPFDKAKARTDRQTWADHLNLPLEITNSIGMKMRLIPPRDMRLGRTDVEITESLKKVNPKDAAAFYISVHEVTQEQYQKVAGLSPSANRDAPGAARRHQVRGLDTRDFPVDSVSWSEAALFCNKLSVLEGLPPYYRIVKDKITALGGAGYRLPTMNEYWDAAGPNGQPVEPISRYAWLKKDSGGRPHAVGTKEANLWGVCDLFGNLVELLWTPDANNSMSGDKGNQVFGGCFTHDGPSILHVWPRYRAQDGGFRVARQAKL